MLDLFRSQACARITRCALATAMVASLAGCGEPPPAPDVGYTLLDGRQARLSDFRGQVVLVNFWSTDCVPCIREMPALVQTWKRYAARGFETISVSTRDDPPFAVIRFATQRALPFSVTMDQTGAIARGFGDIAYTPTSLLIDKRGRIVARWIGASDFQKLDATIERLLQES